MSSKLKHFSAHSLSFAASLAFFLVALNIGFNPQLDLAGKLPPAVTNVHVMYVLFGLSLFFLFSCQVIEFDKKRFVSKKICFLGLVPWKSRRYNLEEFTSVHVVLFRAAQAGRQATYLLGLSGGDTTLELTYFRSSDKIRKMAQQIEDFSHLKVSKEASNWGSWNQKKNPAAYELPPEGSIRRRVLEFLFRSAKKASAGKRSHGRSKTEKPPLERARENAQAGKRLLAIIQYKKHLREKPDDEAASAELARLEQG